MSDDRHTDSTMTKLMRSSEEDAILHRALTLPTQFPGKIVLLDNDGRSMETKYVFESSEPVGEGGTAIVYRVRDTQLGVVRAMKVLLVDLRSDSVAGQRWRRERDLLLALEKVDAPCVPTIYDVGVAGGLPVIVMQFVSGVTLAQEMSDLLQSIEGSLPFNRVQEYLRFLIGVTNTLASSLAHVEKHFAGTDHQGFAHGDIKPSNIIVERRGGQAAEAFGDFGRVWLLDFGEASVRSGCGPRGLTPAFSSPEQLADWTSQRSPRTTPATDQYQLGIVLQELLKPIQVYSKLGRVSPRSIRCAWEIRHLSRIATKMTARLATDRFVDFSGVSQALARTESLPRRRMVTSLALPAIGAVVSISLLSFRGPRDVRDSRPTNPGLAATSVQNEWKRWQEPPLSTASDQQLNQQLTARAEQWRAAFGKATAESIVVELHRRLSLLKGGKYLLRIIDASPDTDFNQRSGRFSDRSPDTVVLTLSINDKDVASLKGTVTDANSIAFDVDRIPFSWEPGERVELFVRTESRSERQAREKSENARKARDEAEEKYKAARARYEEDLAKYEVAKANGKRVFPPRPPTWIPSFVGLPHFSLAVAVGGSRSNGGVMSLPCETKCDEVENRSLVGKFDFDSIKWHIEISPMP